MRIRALAKLLELELELELELLLELLRGMIQREKFVRIFRELDIYIVVGPGMESCSAGKNGKEAIVVNNSD